MPETDAATSVRYAATLARPVAGTRDDSLRVLERGGSGGRRGGVWASLRQTPAAPRRRPPLPPPPPPVFPQAPPAASFHSRRRARRRAWRLGARLARRGQTSPVRARIAATASAPHGPRHLTGRPGLPEKSDQLGSAPRRPARAVKRVEASQAAILLCRWALAPPPSQPPHRELGIGPTALRVGRRGTKARACCICRGLSSLPCRIHSRPLVPRPLPRCHKYRRTSVRLPPKF